MSYLTNRNLNNRIIISRRGLTNITYIIMNFFLCSEGENKPTISRGEIRALPCNTYVELTIFFDNFNIGESYSHDQQNS